MEKTTTVERRTLISEAWTSGHRLLILRTPLLLEAGQRYWVDVTTVSVIVGNGDGHRQVLHGGYAHGPDAPR